MNKKAIVLISILSIIIVGLVGYIILDTTLEKKNKKQNKETTSTLITSKEQKVYKEWKETYAEGMEPIIFKCLNETGDKECLVIDDEMKVSLKKELPNNEYDTYENNYLYINDKRVEFLVYEIDNGFDILSITKVDKETIFIEVMGFDGGVYYLINKDGNKVTDFSDVGKLKGVGNVKFENNKFIISTMRYGYDYESVLCKYYLDDDYAYIKEETEYLGNGKFGEVKVLESSTVDEVIRNKFGMSCDELKNSTDPGLEYHRALANGEM